MIRPMILIMGFVLYGEALSLEKSIASLMIMLGVGLLISGKGEYQ